MRSLIGSVTVLALTMGLAAAADPIDFKNLVGKWELADAKPGQALTLEFTKDMKMAVIVVEAGKETKIEGKYKVIEPDKLNVHLSFGSEEIAETLTVKKLTADELQTEDSKGKTESLKRKK